MRHRARTRQTTASERGHDGRGTKRICKQPHASVQHRRAGPSPLSEAPSPPRSGLSRHAIGRAGTADVMSLGGHLQSVPLSHVRESLSLRCVLQHLHWHDAAAAHPPGVSSAKHGQRPHSRLICIEVHFHGALARALHLPLKACPACVTKEPQQQQRVEPCLNSRRENSQKTTCL